MADEQSYLDTVVSKAAGRLRDVQSAIPERRSRFGPDFDPQSLGSLPECLDAIREISAEIADITAQLERYPPGSEPDDTAMRWIMAARKARAHRIATRRLIESRRVELNGKPLSLANLTAEDVLRLRAEKHRLKMERIATSEARNLQIHSAFKKLARQRFGDEVITDLLRQASALVDEQGNPNTQEKEEASA